MREGDLYLTIYSRFVSDSRDHCLRGVQEVKHGIGGIGKHLWGGGVYTKIM